MNQQTRGERLNNPGNLDRTATVWQGMSNIQPDIRFIKFDTPEMGIRALAKTLLTYYRKYGLTSVKEIIDRWAPPTENDTSAYVAHVADLLSVGIDDQINVEDSGILITLVKAIIAHENGRVIYADNVIEDGVDKALA